MVENPSPKVWVLWTEDVPQIFLGVFKGLNNLVWLGYPCHWILLEEIFPVVRGTPRGSFWLEREVSLKVKTPVSGLKPQNKVTWHISISCRHLKLRLRVSCHNLWRYYPNEGLQGTMHPYNSYTSLKIIIYLGSVSSLENKKKNTQYLSIRIKN